VEDEIAVVLDGVVYMKSHSENILPPKLLAKYEQGDIMGFREGDSGLSSKVETWCVVRYPTEVAFFKPTDFKVRVRI